MQFLTSGGGTWRANPNLYNNGKVCLWLVNVVFQPQTKASVSEDVLRTLLHSHPRMVCIAACRVLPKILKSCTFHRPANDVAT